MVIRKIEGFTVLIKFSFGKRSTGRHLGVDLKGTKGRKLGRKAIMVKPIKIAPAAGRVGIRRESIESMVVTFLLLDHVIEIFLLV